MNMEVKKQVINTPSGLLMDVSSSPKTKLVSVELGEVGSHRSLGFLFLNTPKVEAVAALKKVVAFLEAN